MQHLNAAEQALLSRALALIAEQATDTPAADAVARLAARLANTPPSEEDRSLRPACLGCGGENVSIDGACRWDEHAAAWVLSSIFDFDGHCDDCGCQRRIDWVPVAQPAKA